MKKLLKVVLILVAVLVLGAAGGIAYVTTNYPDVPLVEDFTIESSAEIVARGEYLVRNVAVCIDCHSSRDMTRQSGPIVAGTVGQGGAGFLEVDGFPGDFYPVNITPAGIGDYTDAELYRAITSGVGRDGHALFAMMPYPSYGRADLEDINAIMAYVRSLRPIENEVPPSRAAFPFNLMFRLGPKPADHQQRPDTSDTIAYGAYLANLAACADCHTPMEKGRPIEGMDYSGGSEFTLPTGTVRSANLTPDRATGIGSWTEDQFVGRFKMYADSSWTPPVVGPGGFNTEMPWVQYAGMAELDLRSIYHYLMSLPPISSQAQRFTSAE